MSITRNGTTRLAKLTRMSTGKIILRWSCYNCNETGEQIVRNTEDRQTFGVSLNVVKNFVRRARGHVPVQNHCVKVSIVDEREYCLDYRKMERAKAMQ